MAVQPIGDLLDLPMRAAERRAAGQALRRLVPRSAHATFVPSPGRRDPVQVLIEADAGRMPGLLPIRYDRMRRSPFAFMRGAMAIMAADLAATPTSGIRVQSVGNCHAANFGIRAMPDGTMTFDINDFDETLPAPFEWDVKRLAGSTAIAAMGRQLPARLQRQIARATVRSYRLEMMALASLDPVIAWHHRTDVDAALEEIGDRRLRERTAQRWAVITAEDHAGYPHLLERHKGLPRLREHPPLLIRFTAGTSDAHEAATRAAFASYRRTLEEERRVLLDRYHLIDVALKVAGVAGVGTFCAIGLFLSPDNAPLLLQIREAQRSLLSP